MTSSRQPRQGSADSDHVKALDERLDAALAQLAAEARQAVRSGLLAQQKESLMTTIQNPTVVAHPAVETTRIATHRRGPARRRLLLAGGSAALGASLLVGGPAAAGHVMTWLGRAPVTTQEADRMQVIYHGEPMTESEIQQLQSQGKATITVQDPASQAKGQAHAFDTRVEADAWACVHVPGLSARPVCHSSSSPTARASGRS